MSQLDMSQLDMSQPDMSQTKSAMPAATRKVRGLSLFVVLMLMIEFMDELVFSTREASLPLIRADLGLDYNQIGILLTVPIIIANLIEPVMFLIADIWKRKTIIIIGAVLFAVELMVTALAQDFWVMLIAFSILAPSSGMFVTLSQAALMDYDPERHENNMARWAFAGSLSTLIGPLVLSLSLVLGGGWRGVFLLYAVITLIPLILLIRREIPQVKTDESPETLRDGLRVSWQALKEPAVRKWLILLEFSNLMLDVLLSFLALYLVDVAGATETNAVLAVSVWVGVGLLGDFLLIPLLERVRGLTYLRISAVIVLFLFPVFLLVPDVTLKLVILAALGFFNSGWYAILQSSLYTTMQGRVGTALVIGNVSNMFGSFIPLIIGLVAERYGLNVAIWLLMAGPIALVIGLRKD
jgi:MFS transporter, FSR family, fosmidomycin resistance protein